MTKKNTKILFLSDTHIGSKLAIFPEKFETSEGNIVKSNLIQDTIRKYFFNTLRNIESEFGSIDYIVHLGDTIQGPDRKGRKIFLSLSNLDDQIEAFCQLFKPLKEYQGIVLSNSNYHDSIDSRASKVIADRFNWKFIETMTNITFKPSKRVFNIAHEISSSFVYLASTLDREGLFLKMAEAFNKFPKIDCVVRGHLHLFQEIHQRDLHLLLVPGLTLLEPNKISVKYLGRKLPDIGFCVCIIDHKDRIRFLHFLYENDKALYEYYFNKILKET
ncbi:MAG TPA: hypothetical protein PKV21_09435 [bacterium]|nr:hypothetical protein [bacterium]